VTVAPHGYVYSLYWAITTLATVAPRRYVYSLYWAITTLATVGYGDLHAVNVYETTWAIVYMFINLGLSAYVLGRCATNRIQLVLFGMQNRTVGPCLAFSCARSRRSEQRTMVRDCS
jgi:Ion channel